MGGVRVRFAPSPTGNPHVGSIRTALYNFLFARKNKGTFVLRIEDTDAARTVQESYQAITDSLEWLKLSWDEGPILQSQRLEIYQKHAQELIDKRLAYQNEGAVYFKTTKGGQTPWIDLVGNKRIEFDNKTQNDFVLLRSNGWPTYHLAAVIDDHLMEITHVIRGEDWISSTPKHLMLYTAFGWEAPYFVHLPTILASDRSKLSKRHGAVGVFDFKKDGYLSEALVNYISLLGWTPPSGREILTLKEMVEEFDLQDVNTAPAIFDIKKLEWINGEYIRMMSNEDLTKRLQEFLVDHPAKNKIGPVIPLVKERIKKLADFIPLTYFIWEKPEYEKAVFAKAVKSKEINIAAILSGIKETMANLSKPWTAEEFEQTFRQLAAKQGLTVGEVFQLIRVAVSGQLVTPPLFQTMKLIGEEEVLERLTKITSEY